MKFGRFFFITIFAFFIFGLSACSVHDEEVVGIYTCARLELNGEEFHVLDVYPKGSSLHLSKWGQAWLNIEDDSFYGRWELEENDFILDINGEISCGKLENGVCTLSFGDNGMVHSFLKSGATLPEKTAAVQQQQLTQQQIFWNGDWYGYWTINNAQGAWQDQSGQRFDCFARFDIDADGNGKMVLWDEKQDYSHPISVAELFISMDDSTGNAGIAVTTGGNFLDSELVDAQWSVDPDSHLGDSVFFIEDAHYEGEDAAFDYSIVLRPWGRTWEDIEATNPDMLPYFYYDWYLPALAEGAVMPDSFKYDRETIIRNTWQETRQE